MGDRCCLPWREKPKQTALQSPWCLAAGTLTPPAWPRTLLQTEDLPQLLPQRCAGLHSSEKRAMPRATPVSPRGNGKIPVGACAVSAKGRMRNSISECWGFCSPDKNHPPQPLSSSSSPVQPLMLLLRVAPLAHVKAGPSMDSCIDGEPPPASSQPGDENEDNAAGAFLQPQLPGVRHWICGEPVAFPGAAPS